MDQKVLFEKNSSSVKSPQHLENNVFVVYAPRSIKIEPAICRKIDTEVTVFLPQNLRGLLNQAMKR